MQRPQREKDLPAPVQEELKLEAIPDNLPLAVAFVEKHLNAIPCPAKVKGQIGVAVEETFVNIARYAYGSGRGQVSICVEISEKPPAVAITFKDRGVPFDPLSKSDPDVSAPAPAREPGGLGILITKKLMDEVRYSYLDHQNLL